MFLFNQLKCELSNFSKFIAKHDFTKIQPYTTGFSLMSVIGCIISYNIHHISSTRIVAGMFFCIYINYIKDQTISTTKLCGQGGKSHAIHIATSFCLVNYAVVPGLEKFISHFAKRMLPSEVISSIAFVLGNIMLAYTNDKSKINTTNNRQFSFNYWQLGSGIGFVFSAVLLIHFKTEVYNAIGFSKALALCKYLTLAATFGSVAYNENVVWPNQTIHNVSAFFVGSAFLGMSCSLDFVHNARTPTKAVIFYMCAGFFELLLYNNNFDKYLVSKAI